MDSFTAACYSGDNADEDTTAAMGADLLDAAYKGQVDEVTRILEMNPDLLKVGDPVGDTALHVFARVGHVGALRQLIKFLQDQHKELLSDVAIQENGHGDTPLHLAAMYRHRKATVELFKAASVASCLKNDDGKTPWNLTEEGEFSLYGNEEDWSDCEQEQDQELELEVTHDAKQELELDVVDDEDKTHEESDDGMSSSQNKNELVHRYEQLLAYVPSRNFPFPSGKTAFANSKMRVRLKKLNTLDNDKGNTILEMLEANPNLIRHKNKMGNTVLHEAASSGITDMLTKLLELLTTSYNDHDNKPKLDLLLEGNNLGNTALHLAILKRHKTAARYLMEVAPEVAYQLNSERKSPLYLALQRGHDDLVTYVLQVMPKAALSSATMQTLLTAKKGSLPHAAIRLRNFAMLQLILERIPTLIDTFDEKGWKPLSYAAYKGHLEEVGYMLNKFPESAEKFDSDGSLPIHKTVSGGHISIIKEFISSHPQSLHAVDKKGRSVLHIAVRYAKADILSYLTKDTDGIQNVLELRDHEGKTFLDLAKALKCN